jgi:hypothetical protein
MAEATALRNNALPYPVYGVPWTVVIPVLDADGDLVTTAAGLDSEVSLNGNTFADCTNEATEIATGSGMYYLTLTAAEMTADIVAVIVKTSTSGAKTTPLVLYPRKLITLASGTSQGGAAGYITLAANSITYDDRYNGCLCVGTLDTLVEARILQDCTASNQQCTVTPGWNTSPDADDTYIIYLPEGMQVPTPNVIRVGGTASAFLGTDGKPLISTDAQDLSGTLAVEVKRMSGVDTGILINSEDNLLMISAYNPFVAGLVTRAGLLDTGSSASVLNTVEILLPNMQGVAVLTSGSNAYESAPILSTTTHQITLATALSGAPESGTNFVILPPVNLAIGSLSAAQLTADAIDAILDEVVEGTLTLRQVLRILLAKATLKASGGGTTSVAFRDLADSKNRIAMTVDASGNRSAVTLDGT